MPRAARERDAWLCHVSIAGGARRRGCPAAGVSEFLDGPLDRPAVVGGASAWRQATCAGDASVRCARARAGTWSKTPRGGDLAAIDAVVRGEVALAPPSVRWRPRCLIRLLRRTNLTAREAEVLALRAERLMNSKIADWLVVSAATVKSQSPRSWPEGPRPRGGLAKNIARISWHHARRVDGGAP